MKNFTAIVAYVLFLFVAIVGLSYCNKNKLEDNKEVAEENNESKFKNSKMEKDASFLVEAAEINREEITLGQLALQKGNTSHVIELGKMMEEAHMVALSELTELAQTKNISLPISQTEDEKEDY